MEWSLVPKAAVFTFYHLKSLALALVQRQDLSSPSVYCFRMASYFGTSSGHVNGGLATANFDLLTTSVKGEALGKPIAFGGRMPEV